MATKMQILFDGFDDLAADIDRINGDLTAAVDDALKQTASLVQDNLQTAAAPYATNGKKGYATGAMYKTMVGKDESVDWEGTVASVDVGFRIRKDGGWHSIFIMYGTPRIQKDTKVYNAIRGSKTKKQIAALQQQVMSGYLELGGKND